MIESDGGGGRSFRQAAFGPDGIGPTEMGRRAHGRSFAESWPIRVERGRSVTAITAEPPAFAYVVAVLGAGCPAKAKKRSPCRTASLRLQVTVPRGRASGLGREARPPPRRSPTARGERARRLRGFCAPGRRARKPRAPLTEPETPSACAHGRVGLAAGGGRSRACRRTWSHFPRRRPAGHARTGSRCRSPWARAGRDRRYTPSVRDIGRMTDRLPPARTEPRRAWQAKGRSRRGWPWLQPRNVAPVFLDTSDTILATVASISASVSVRSRGCRVTWMATDFAPSGRPSPR